MDRVIRAYWERKIRRLELLSNEELQKEAQRPFRGWLNSCFDFNKYCALVILRSREIKGGLK